MVRHDRAFRLDEPDMAVVELPEHLAEHVHEGRQ
jgi:hypothetical protein